MTLAEQLELLAMQLEATIKLLEATLQLVASMNPSAGTSADAEQTEEPIHFLAGEELP